MKPNFALSLSFEGIKLLHRAAGGWREVGEVAVTAEDLAGELAMLRKTASSLEPGGVRTKLLIPESQIKYLTIDTVGLSENARRKEAEAALHDATPYELSELAYDISIDGAKTHVAAVARETLVEAEAFATEHRFHPVSFVAVPGDAPYLGEPFFGPTKGAVDLLEPEEVVEADGIAVVIVGAVAAEAAQPAPIAKDPQPELAFDLEPVDVPATQSELPTQPAPEAPIPSPEFQTAQKAEVDQPAKAAPAEPISKASIPEPIVSDTRETAETETEVLESPKEPNQPSVASQSVPETPETKPSNPSKTDATLAEETQSEGNAAVAVAAAVATVARTDPPVEDIPQTKRNAPASGFSSRRGAPPVVGKPLGGAQRTAATPVMDTPAPDSSSLTQQEAVAPAAQPAPAKTGFFSRRKPRAGAAAPVPAPKARIAATGSEAERMTVFGARSDQVGGKPRFLGLIMTAILLVFLAGVAAWAAVFLDEGLAGLIGRDEERTTASALENQIDPEIIRTPEGIVGPATTTGETVQIAALDPVLSAEDTAVLDALQDARPEPQTPVITEQEAAARYAVTGIWPLAPSTPLAAPDTIPEPVYRSGIDGASPANDAIALPEVQELDANVQLAAALSPPPFGQSTALDANGLVIPTAAGVVTPGGFTLIAASPPVKPPATIARFSTQPSVTPAVVAPETSPLFQFRPQNRPLGLSERAERAQLGGVSRVELAAFRPSLRPRSLQDRARQAEEEAKAKEEAAKAAEEARTAAAAEAATAAAAAALTLPTPEAEAATAAATAAAAAAAAVQSGTKFAIAKSTRPDPRPRNFARIVKRAESKAPKETRVAAAAQVAPRTVAPKVPSKASVARSATVKNAINLRKVNLIGVYGKPSSRRALVRLSNGRYKKVRVGDRIDGGRISAISNSELRYSKGGRNVVLKMP